MAIDRAEAIGLSATVGGHGLILAALYFGIFGMEEKIEKPATLSVTLEGEGSPLPVTGELGEASAAPEFVEEAESELEAAADEADDTADAAAKAEAEAARTAAAAKAANATAEEKRAAREAAAKAAKKRRDAEAARKKREKAERDRKRRAEEERKRREQAQKDFDGVGENLGGDNASATPGEARGAATASISGEVKPFIRRNCKLSTGEPSSLRVFAALTISKDGALRSASIYDVKGVSPQNRTQVEPAKRCALQSLRQASPYNLNPADYNVWKNHRVQIKVNIK